VLDIDSFIADLIPVTLVSLHLGPYHAMGAHLRLHLRIGYWKQTTTTPSNMLPVLWMTQMNIWTIKVCSYPYRCNGIAKSGFPGIDVREHGAKGWVPVPLRSWFWIPLVTFMVLLAMGLELALYFSNKNEGDCATRLSFRSY
jgi:hypothetical protein